MGAAATQNQVDRKLDRVILTDASRGELSGRLAAFSDFDDSDPALGQHSYPFLSDADQVPASFGKPGKTIQGSDGKTIAYQESGNFAFRSIDQVPPAAAIQSVKSLQLRLEGVRIFVPDSESDPFKNQVLCLIETKTCLGRKPDGADAGIDPDFFTDARTFEEAFRDSTAVFTESTAIKGGKLVSPKDGVWMLDLKALFKLDDAAAKDFILRNSTEFSNADAGFRKFRFILGNRVFASGGSLQMEFALDPALVPAGFSSRLPVPLHGESDRIHSKESKKSGAVHSKLELKLDDAKLWEGDGLSLAGKEILKDLGARLLQGMGEIKEIQVSPAGDADQAESRGRLLKAALVDAGLNDALFVPLDLKKDREHSVSLLQVGFTPESKPSPERSAWIGALEHDFSGSELSVD
jgi:hypothetical protein